MIKHPDIHDDSLRRIFDHLDDHTVELELPVGATPVLSDEASEIVDIRAISAGYRDQGWLTPEIREAVAQFDPTAYHGGAIKLMPQAPNNRRRYLALGCAAAMSLMAMSYALASLLAG